VEENSQRIFWSEISVNPINDSYNDGYVLHVEATVCCVAEGGKNGSRTAQSEIVQPSPVANAHIPILKTFWVVTSKII